MTKIEERRTVLLPPRVSVALATYNGERFLPEQLNSLIEQTLLPFELVVSDDGSTDGTVAILQDFAARAPFPVTVLQGSARLNYRLNFRRATEHCSGDLIAFCDQDDVWDPEKLEKMARAFSEPTVLLAYHNAVVSSAEATRMLHSAEEEDASLREQPMAPFKSPNGLLMLFRANLRRFDDLWDMTIDQNEGDVVLAHDQWYFFLARALGEVRFIDEPLLIYRQHSGNTLGVASERSLRETIARRLVHFGTADEWAAKSADSRAAVLRVMLDREGGERLGHVADSYEALAKRRRARAAIYCRNSVGGRLAGLIHCLACGHYRGGTWAFNPASIVRDLWSGVVRARCTDPTR